MRPIRPASLAVVAVVFSATACSAPAGREWQSIGSPGSNLNGSNLNGSNLNGSNLNGSSTAGSILVSVDFAGASLENGTPLEETWLEGSLLRGRIGETEYAGNDFKNAQFAGTRDDGSTVSLRVEDVVDGSDANVDVWTYTVSYRESDGSWWPICRNDSGAVPAVAVNGRWDYSQGTSTGGSKISDPGRFTLACRGTAAIAKCVEMGYKPWASAQGVLLDAHHQSCVRLIRADFCGDGTSYTVDGTWVNLYDGLGVQTDTEDWLFEAEWDAGGARCFSPHNRAHETVPCFDKLLDLACGDLGRFATGTLLMNETP